MATKIHRSIAFARGVPDNTSGRRVRSASFSAIVAIAFPPRVHFPLPPYHNRRTRGTPLLVSLKTVIAQTIASARSGRPAGTLITAAGDHPGELVFEFGKPSREKRPAGFELDRDRVDPHSCPSTQFFTVPNA